MAWFVSFGVQYPREPHPRHEWVSGEGLVRVEVDDELEARKLTIGHFDRKWSCVYAEDELPQEQRDRFFPLGVLATITADGELVRHGS